MLKTAQVRTEYNRKMVIGKIHVLDLDLPDYKYICGIGTYDSDEESITDFNFSYGFCKTCNKILKKKGIDMKQLAINQKLGVKT